MTRTNEEVTALVRRAAEGDGDAREELMTCYRQRLKRIRSETARRSVFRYHQALEARAGFLRFRVPGCRVMPDDSSVDLQQLIDRFPQGGAEVRRELLELAMNRLRRLAAKMLGQSFPALQVGHDVDSVVHETWLRLLPALDQTEPETVQDFFRLAAHKIRQVLLDMVERGRRFSNQQPFPLSDSSVGFDPSQTSFDPAQLMMWSEFHQRVATLEDNERQVFEMHYYLEIPKVQIARLLNVPPRKVSQLWIKATDQLTVDLALVDGIF